MARCLPKPCFCCPRCCYISLTHRLCDDFYRVVRYCWRTSNRSHAALFGLSFVALSCCVCPEPIGEVITSYFREILRPSVKGYGRFERRALRRSSPTVTPGLWPATMNENGYTYPTTPPALRSVDSRAASRSAVGSRCPEAWPFVASPVDSTQESICYERAPCWWRRPTLG